MPELPEVETIRIQLEEPLSGRLIYEADSHPSAKFTPALAVIGASILRSDRRGKFLLFGTDDGRELVVHLGMTGQLGLVHRPPDLNNPYLRAWWRLDDGMTLQFVDVRRFGRIRVVEAGDYASMPTLHNAGPEPFDESFDGEHFWRLLCKSRRRLKTQLLSQRPVAGVGNIYADEALWLAKINPRITRIGKARASALLEAIRTVLLQGLNNGGTTLQDYRDARGRSGDNQSSLAAYGRAGLPCLRCTITLRSAIIDARTTTWCPQCQIR